jgi:hypothetical protein
VRNKFYFYVNLFFKVYENDLKRLDDKISIKMKTDKTPLENVNKNNPFTVPEGYFENLTTRIMDTLPEEKIEETSVKIGVWKKVTPWIYMAAMLCGIAFGIRLYLGYDQNNYDGFSAAHQKSEAVPISEEDILISGVSDYELFEYLYDEDGNF